MGYFSFCSSNFQKQPTGTSFPLTSSQRYISFEISQTASFNVIRSTYKSGSQYNLCHCFNENNFQFTNELNRNTFTTSGHEMPSFILSHLSNGSSNMRIFEKNIFLLMALVSTVVLVLEVLINDIRQLKRKSNFPPEEGTGQSEDHVKGSEWDVD